MSRRTQSNQSRRRQTNRAGNPQRRRKVHTKYKFSTRRMYQRTFIALGAIVLFALVCVGWTIWLGQSKGDEYEKIVLSQQSYVSNTIAYRRGDILDRNGNKLASSKKVYNLVLDPKALTLDSAYFEPTTKALQQTVGMSEGAVRKIIDKKPDSHYYVVKKYKGLSRDVVDAFNELADKDKNIQGVWFEEEYVRQYPYSTVASNVIGFCSSDNVGIWGIENQYNSQLSGKTGKKYGYYDSDLNLVENVKEPENGKKIISTIDVNVQGVLEQHMQKFQTDTGSENMGVIIMNPNNGEIYAMASSPGYDLNDPSDLSKYYSEDKLAGMSDKKKMEELNEIWRNFCISDAYEPGSTFKPITVAASLEEGTTSPSRTYVCDGYQKVGGSKIKCVAFSKGGHGTINICQALMESCNDALMQMGDVLGGKRFLKYVNDFGYGQKTGIDLPGEAATIMHKKENIGPVELATISFGQSFQITPIQLITTAASIVNGGRRITPHFALGTVSPDGKNYREFSWPLGKRILSEETSATMRYVLEQVVAEGSGRKAAVEGFSIGGKTATSEKLPRSRKKYISSFLGFAPANDPKVIALITIDEPEGIYYGGTIAAPVIGTLFENILPCMDTSKPLS